MTTLVVIGAINVDLVVSGARCPRPARPWSAGLRAAPRRQGREPGRRRGAGRSAREGVVIVGAVGEDAFGSRRAGGPRAGGCRVDTRRDRSACRPGSRSSRSTPTARTRSRWRPARTRSSRRRDVTSAVRTGARDRGRAGEPRGVHDRGRAAAAWCTEHEVPFVLNPAPVQPWAAEVACARPTYLTPNEHELEALGSLPDGVVVVETRGADGVLIRRGRRGDARGGTGASRPSTPPAPGDCFNGVFAAGPGRRHGGSGGRKPARRARDRRRRSAVDPQELGVPRQGIARPSCKVSRPRTSTCQRYTTRRVMPEALTEDDKERGAPRGYGAT